MRQYILETFRNPEGGDRMEKREIREGLLRAERARKQLIRPKLQELGLTPGQGQVGILNRLLQRPNISQRDWQTCAILM